MKVRRAINHILLIPNNGKSLSLPAMKDNPTPACRSRMVLQELPTPTRRDLKRLLTTLCWAEVFLNGTLSSPDVPHVVLDNEVQDNMMRALALDRFRCPRSFKGAAMQHIFSEIKFFQAFLYS